MISKIVDPKHIQYKVNPKEKKYHKEKESQKKTPVLKTGVKLLP